MLGLQAQLSESATELEKRLRAEAQERETALQQQLASLTVRLKAEANDKESALAALQKQVRLAVAARSPCTLPQRRAAACLSS